MAKTITMFGGLGLSASIAVKQRSGTAVDTQAASEITSGIYQASFTGLAEGTYLVNLVDSSGDINWADVVVVGSADTDYYSKELDNIAESTYAYFVADANEDAFKADISSMVSTLVTINDGINNITTQNNSIAGAVDDVQTRIPAILESGRMAAALDSTATAALVDLIWDEPLTGATHNVATSSGKRLRQASAFQQIDGAINDASATTTSFVTTLSSSVNNFYNDSMIVFNDGVLAGQVRAISNYVGSTKSITVSEALTSAPANGDTFTIISMHIHPVNQIADGILKRNVSNVEATAGEHTLATAVLSMLEWEISGSNLIIKRTDGTTVHYTKVLSSATGTGDVITGLN
jgi:hypothetical protein